jgi:hypothetical protein
LGCYIGSTAVVTAAAKGFTDIVKLLIRSGANLHKKLEGRPILIHQSDGSEACPAPLFLARRCNDASSLTSLFVLFSSGVVSLKAMSTILKVCDEGYACETKSDEEAREFSFCNPDAVSVMLKEIMESRSIQYTIVPRIMIAARNRCPMFHENHPIWRDVFEFLGKKRRWIRHPLLAKERESRVDKQAARDDYNFRALVNRRIRVSWNKDRSYFDGTITEFDAGTRKWTVKYDDGDVRKYDLSALTRTIFGQKVTHAGRFRLLRDRDNFYLKLLQAN